MSSQLVLILLITFHCLSFVIADTTLLDHLHDGEHQHHFHPHSKLHRKHEIIKFGSMNMHVAEWEELKQLIDCWTELGGSWDYMNITIIDNILLYSPCPLRYNIKNPCSWILDKDSLKYYWNPNYLTNPKCLKILTISEDDPNSSTGTHQIIVSEKNNGNRSDITRLRSNTKITRLADFDSPTMCYILTSNSTYKSSQLNDVLLETDNAPSKLRGGILIVGDSVSELIAPSLRNMFLLGNNQSCPTNGIEYVCHHQIRIDFIRNDWLTLVNETKIVENVDGRHEYPWIPHLEAHSHEYSLLILNRGAHYRPDDEVLAGLNETLTYVTTRFPHIGILWRNTVQGDHGYKSHFFSKPLKEPLKWGPNTKFYYDLFEGQNEVVKIWLGKHFPQVVYFDVYTSLAMRRDARFDSMHPCVPGPVDTWSKFIYNILKYIYTHAIADPEN